MAKLQKNLDGWSNIYTGLGTSKDKSVYSEKKRWRPLPRTVCESLFSADEIGAKAAKIIPYDATREGITWNMEEREDHEDVVKFLDTEFDRLDVWSTFAWAWTLARVYGGSLVYISVDDGVKDLSRPLNPKRIKKVKALRVFDRHEVTVTSMDIDNDLGSDNYNKPEFYMVNDPLVYDTSNEQLIIHHSRFIRFEGVQLPNDQYIKNNYWSDSIYNGLYDALRNYGVTHDAIAVILQEFNQPVYGIEGLSEALANDAEELVIQKVELTNLMRSVARAIILDKEDEFTNVSTNVAGGKELVDLTVQRLVAGIDVPHTRLLGNSPTGLGGTGMSELINYYDNVRAQQKVVLRSPVKTVEDLLFNQTLAPEKPEDLAFQFNPLFQLDREKEERSRQMQADIDETYINTGVLTPQEVADSRFATGRYSYETIINPEEVREVPEVQAKGSENNTSTEPDEKNDV